MTTCTTGTCPACMALAARYQRDPVLLAHYRTKLLVLDWAGLTDATEKAYYRAHSPRALAGQKAAAKNFGRAV